MAIFEIIGEVAGRIFLEALPMKIQQWITDKEAELDGFKTEQKQFVKFDDAKVLLLIWETDMEQIKYKMTDRLRTMSEKLHVTDFQFKTIDGRTIIQPPTSISFYTFHFLVQWFTKHNIKTVGIVETDATTYTTYNDLDSEHLIGQTDEGKTFFISLMDDHSRKQFLRINTDIKTIEEFDVLTIKSWLRQSPQDV